MFLYVLKLEDDCWYVGIAKDPMKRAYNHCGGSKGAAWTRKHKPIQPVKDNIVITDLGDLKLSECELKEDMVTEECRRNMA